MPPLGTEARMSRLVEACEDRGIRNRILLFKATECPEDAVIMYMLEWAYLQLTGYTVPKKSRRQREKAREQARRS